eukprot:CAMPEP_0113937076 /NCGR_PEP_ID=MMETSP1339-20121228/3779_1 /TAXON_ID=94617 /ORGANISM="Fibrocapsa japonica" /LENGTH=380 /DNA_ID=CAMNT_0000939713 /DNA_START=13 /DNA_END=1155 /DNA_ORIENTATION=- /assembly_acc=CAM_ASM_000762
MKYLLLFTSIYALIQFCCSENECSLPLGAPCVALNYEISSTEGLYYDEDCTTNPGGFHCDVTHIGCKKCTIDVDCPACVKEYHTAVTRANDPCALLDSDACIQDTSNVYMARGIGMYNSGGCTAEDPLCDSTFTACHLCVFDPALYSENCEDGPDGGACGAADLPACPSCVTEEFFTKLGHVPTGNTGAGAEDTNPAEAAQEQMKEEGEGAALSSDAACLLPEGSPCTGKVAHSDHHFGLMLIYDQACQSQVPGCHAYARNCRLCVANDTASAGNLYMACPDCGKAAYQSFVRPTRATPEPEAHQDDLHDSSNPGTIATIVGGVCMAVALLVGIGYTVVYRHLKFKHAYEQVNRNIPILPYAGGDEDDDIDPMSLETSHI